jgi:acetyl-CoA synthetase
MSRYKINNLEEYFKEYKKSVREPKNLGCASENFTQRDKVVDFNMAEAEIKWFVDAKSILLKNCIDRHLAKGDKTAIILSQMTQVKRLYIFHILNCINKFQNGKRLARSGVQKGDRMHIFTNDSRISY